jgi:hypothetical protein
MKINIPGAGSIGNHFSHTAQSLSWPVDLIDVDPAAFLEEPVAQNYAGAQACRG